MTDVRHIHLGLWLQYLGPADWKDPDSRAEEVNTLDPYVDIALAAEAAGLDAVIRGDGPSFHASHGGLPYAGALELITLTAALAARTERIGLISTASTTFSEPYTLARQFATIDHISNGRVGWNIVTSSAGEKNYGFDELPGQDARYDRADEFLDVVTKLWSSWEDDAVVIDRSSGRFTDPAKIHAIDHVGEHFRVEGPLNVSRSPQGRPVLIQAGSSERGKRFAAEHAELVFTAQQEVAKAAAFYAELKDRVRANGRRPEHVKVLPGLALVLRETEEAAHEANERDLAVIDYDKARTALEDLLGGIDLSDVDLDEQVPLERWPDTSLLTRRQSRPQIFIDLAIENGYTLRKVLQSVAGSFGHGRFVGTPEQVADRIVRWVDAGAADGFVIFPSGGWETIRLLNERVVPILRARGRFRSEYTGTTLRDHFGLPPVSPLEREEAGNAA